MNKYLGSLIGGLFIILAVVTSYASEITYTYDQLNRLTSVRYADGTTIEYIYDDIGNRIIRNVMAPSGPDAAFTASPFTGTAPLTVAFTDQSTGGVTSRSWDFGDGENSTAQNPQHTYSTPGVFTAILTVSNGSGYSSQSETIRVNNASLIADFGASPVSGSAPLTVSFTDNSSGDITNWSWNFGDGETSLSQNPNHTYTNAGIYTVALVVGGPGGSSAPKSIVITVDAPVAHFSASPENGVAPLAVQFTDASTGPVTSWLWDLGDGQTSSDQNPRHIYSSPGTYTVSLTAVGPGGSSTAAQTNCISVSDPPAPWANRIAFQIDNTKIDADLANFPVFLNLDGSLSPGVLDVFTQLGSDTNRKKIRVTADDGVTQCFVEIERWDTSSQTAQLHATVPTVSHSTTTTLYFYYDPAQPDNTDYVGDTGSTVAANVWDADFIGVWHMSQNPGAGGSCILDSTRNGLHGTPYNMNSQNLQGEQIDFNGVNQRISCGINTAFQPSNTVTVESVLTADTAAASCSIAQYGKAYGQSYGLSISGQLGFAFYNGEWRTVTDPDVFPTGVPVYGAGLYNGSVLSVFTNGVLKNSADYTGTFDYSYLGGFTIGSYYTSSGFSSFLDGRVSEVRVSRTSRSDAWIKATYHNLLGSLVWPEDRAPLASFSAAPVRGSAPLTVQFSDHSNGVITDWLWDFGDGQTSTSRNPSHTYTNSGIFNVSLTVSGPAGSNTATQTNCISVLDPPASWANRLTFQIDNTKIDADLANFPVFLNLDGSLSPGVLDVFTQLGSDTNRKKIAVTTEDEATQCYVEIERWDTASQTAQLHVKVPTVSHSTSTTLYFYFDPAQPDNNDYVGDTGSTAAANVWDTDFIGVWHMSQNPGAGGSCILDSTRNGLHGTPYNMNIQNLQGTQIDFNGVNQRISCGTNAAFQPSNTVTVESVLTADTITSPRLIAQYGKAYGQSYGLSTGTTGQLGFGFYNGAWRTVTDPDVFLTGVPGYGAGRYNGSVLSVFTNGALKNSVNYTGTFDYAYLGGFTIGSYYTSSGFSSFLDGRVSEVRVSRTPRSDAWIKATYHSLLDSLVFHAGSF